MSNILELYGRMVAEAESRATESWFRMDNLPGTALTHERQKFHQTVTAEIVNRFRNYKIGGIGLENSDYPVDFATWKRLPEFSPLDRGPIIRDGEVEAKLQKVIQELASTMAPEEVRVFLRAIDDSVDVGGAKYVVGFNKLLICSSFSYRMARRAVRLLRVLKQHEVRPSVLLEVGGGYGKTLSDAYTSLGVETAIYVDLPLNLLLAASFLSKSHLGKVNLVWSDEAEIKTGMINLVVPWLIFSKLNVTVDLFINFLSLQHMQAETQNFYLNGLIDRGMSWMYHENRLYPRDGVEGSLARSAPLNAGHCVSSDAIFRPQSFGLKVDPSVDLTIYGQLVRFG